MNKRAFTLIEILCVVIIISVLSIILIPIFTNYVASSRDSVYKNMVNKVLNASLDWASDNAELLPDNDEEIRITLGLLQSDGYITTDLKNPKTDTLFPSDMKILIKYKASSKENEKLDYSKYSGNYFFQVDVDSGTEIGEIKDDYNIIELAATKEEVDAIIYQDKDGNNLSLKEVSIQIIKNNLNVASIDTSKLGLYYIYYSYKNSDETFIRVFNIADTKLPEITFPTDDVINVNVSSFDLYNNVTCVDNSGICNLKIIEGETEFYEALTNQELGNYVISYQGSDEAGNTVVKKRVIEITS